MTSYLKCIRSSRGVNRDECRMLSKDYLKCRMDKNLMAPDEMKNLGYAEGPADNQTVKATSAEELQGKAKERKSESHV